MGKLQLETAWKKGKQLYIEAIGTACEEANLTPSHVPSELHKGQYRQCGLHGSRPLYTNMAELGCMQIFQLYMSKSLPTHAQLGTLQHTVGQCRGAGLPFVSMWCNWELYVAQF